MKRTVHLLGLAFLISVVVFMGIATTAKAYTPHMDEDEEWSTPLGHSYAYVRGSWLLLGHPYYGILHKAGNYWDLDGLAQFIGYNKYGVELYHNSTIVSPNTLITFDPHIYNQVWVAWTHMSTDEYVAAVIGPPGVR